MPGSTCTSALLVRHLAVAVSTSLLLLGACTTAIQIPPTFGAHPSKMSHYSPANGNEKFSCLDGSKSIPWQWVNDDYCDCTDGSDEPGTSACPQGQFHCTNADYKSKDIFSSRVDDRVCDCCDGSDESLHPCPNTCRQLGRMERDKLQKAIETVKKAVELRESLIENAKAAMSRAKTELPKLKDLLLVQEKAVADAQEALSVVVSQKQASENPADAKEIPLTQSQKRVKEGFKSSATEQEQPDVPEDESAHSTTDKILTPTKDVVMASPSMFLTAFQPMMKSVGKVFSTFKSIFFPTEEEKLRSEIGNKSRAVADTKKSIEENEAILEYDWGHDSEFFGLNKKCMIEKFRDYKYEVCLFDKGSQLVNFGVGTSLGTFQGWAELPTKATAWGTTHHRVQQFRNGQYCPALRGSRELDVSFVCQDETRLLEVIEPTPCKYSAIIGTPAVCTQKLVDEIQQEMEF